MNKTMLSILKILDKQPDKILGSRELSRQLKLHGVELTERTVRYHLRILDERGLTKVFGKEGRMITQKGREELSQALVSEKVGFVISKIETLSYLTNFDIEKKEGDIILNVSYFPEEKLKEALRIMKPVFSSPHIMSDKVVIHRGGEKIRDIFIPKGQIGFGTVCSVTINGIFLKVGVPVTSKFGGVLQIENSEPSRFTALISYEGSSLDPLEIFIKSRMTDVLGAVKNHNGKILASFREIPVVSLEKAKELSAVMKEKGIGGILLLGNPNQPLLEMPVSMDRAGMVIVGGLNPIAALEEAGIPTESKAMSTLYSFSDLTKFKELL
ncbi:MAG: NrpR regulatory domain-containing protein [Thermodesulfovibrionales bacterium]|nr:NrpR regulatory domain-containing protein [Thermodesulfovibrionales bacterium]